MLREISYIALTIALPFLEVYWKIRNWVYWKTQDLIDLIIEGRKY